MVSVCGFVIHKHFYTHKYAQAGPHQCHLDSVFIFQTLCSTFTEQHAMQRNRCSRIAWVITEQQGCHSYSDFSGRHTSQANIKHTQTRAQHKQTSYTFNLLEVVSNERWNLWGWTGRDISRWQMSYKEVRRDTTLQDSLIKTAQWTVVCFFLSSQLAWQTFRILENHTNVLWSCLFFLRSQHIIQLMKTPAKINNGLQKRKKERKNLSEPEQEYFIFPSH